MEDPGLFEAGQDAAVFRGDGLPAPCPAMKTVDAEAEPVQTRTISWIVFLHRADTHAKRDWRSGNLLSQGARSGH
jgi:hypothetical protein